MPPALLSSTQLEILPAIKSVVYLNFLAPGAVDRIENVRNVSLVTIGALSWDMLLYLKDEWSIIKSGLQFETFGYFLCRLSTFVYVLLQVVSRTEEVGNCSGMALAIALCEMLSTCSSSFLFFLRVWSLYSDDASIRYPFLVFLITVIGVSSVVPIGKHAVPLPGTRYCLEMRLETYVGATTLLYLLFELSVYLSIAYKIATMPGVSGEATSIRSLATPKTRRRLFRAFFHQGQQHYLASIAFNVAVSVAIIVPSVSSDYKNMLLIPDLALSSVMACRVFRHLTLSTDRLEDALAKSGILAFQNRRPTRDYTTESNLSTLRPTESELDLPFPERPRLRSISLRSMHMPLGPVSEEIRPAMPLAPVIPMSGQALAPHTQ